LPLPADVAQLVEQRFRKPQVTGSNPVVGSSVRFHRGFCVAQLQDYGLAGSRLRLLCVRYQTLSVEIRFQKNFA
jgi:hypothetical protein